MSYQDQNNEEWTTVTYGRRQGRPCQRNWDQVAPWRKDRAPSATFKRRRIHFPYPVAVKPGKADPRMI